MVAVRPSTETPSTWPTGLSLTIRPPGMSSFASDVTMPAMGEP
jgi:hypothetical protein